ncbi:hypothetical protein [Paenisporosarcina antarctica]|uniref:Uncharacterized protein n=1 Tax=Paenisporosarcina antarctica TaxID=417367 RepID=A0A4P6ZUH3_9BACL|nr:hypothetical protein [Paenisporosarcina antarctica]QBP39877.1 hypothetical protein E2636_01325 [Paenisporosarcina antarctica]
MKTDVWNELPAEKREKAASLITEFSSITVSWDDGRQKKILDIFSEFTDSCQEEHNLKPHELMVIAKMLQEFALTNLIEWLPSDFEEWKNKDELMTLFFFGKEGLDSYKEKKGKAVNS